MAGPERPGGQLGGRLRLLAPEALDNRQKRFAARAREAFEPRAKAEGFQLATNDGRLIGPLNPLLRSPAMGDAFLAFQATEAAVTHLDEGCRQIAILMTGGVRKAPYIAYSHVAAARAAGVPKDVVVRLRRGEVADELEGRFRICAKVARSLAVGEPIGEALYADALAAFDAAGLVELTTLVGAYRMLADLLMLFEAGSRE